MTKRAIALFSGGLDSMLATRMMQEQGIEVEAVNFQTMFTCCKDSAAQAARDLGVRLTVIGQEDDYIELIRKPRYGYGKGANPCVDCRIYMFEAARAMMKDMDASFVISGEVLGQRPKSQKRRDLSIIAEQSGLDGLLLRPLSALRLPETDPEREGIVDRSKLFGFVGRGRKELIRLAQHYEFKDIPSPSTGCSLTEKTFATKVHDLVQLDPDSTAWDFQLLNTGRHLRIDNHAKAVVGRRESENILMQQMYHQRESRASIMLTPENFTGPTVLVIGPSSDQLLQTAGGLVVRYSKSYDPAHALVQVTMDGVTRLLPISPYEQAELLATL